MQNKIEKLQTLIKKEKANAIFITNQKNIAYITGFAGISPHEREATCLTTTKNIYLFLPRMYAEQGKNLSAVKNNKVKLIIDDESHGLLTIFVNYTKEKEHILLEGQNLTIAEFEKIRKKSKSLHLIPYTLGLIEQLRIKKDQQEIKNIKKTANITDQVYNTILKILKETDYTKLTELDIVDKIRTISRNLGGDGFGFDPIVACGKNSAKPHYQTNNKHLEKNQPLLLDFGITFKGYTADLTRMIFLGKPTKEYIKTYNQVLLCNKKCIEAIKPGITGKKLHQIATSFFTKHNVNKYFLHNLGHGVGLNIHEAPGIHPYSDTKLQAGMIITIEPGLYFQNKFGVRIEDLILVTKNGYKIISKNSNKNLIYIN